MRKQGEVRSLPVELSPEVLAERSRELANAVQDEDEERRAFASWQAGVAETKKAKQERLAQLHMNTADLAQVVESGVEDQDVECDWLYSLESRKAFLVRRDTGAVVYQRDLQEKELQTSIGDSFQEPTPEQLNEWLGGLGNPESGRPDATGTGDEEPEEWEADGDDDEEDHDSPDRDEADEVLTTPEGLRRAKHKRELSVFELSNMTDDEFQKLPG